MSNTAANNTVDGSVILEVKADVSKADKSLAKLKTKIEKMEKELESKESDKSAIARQLEEATAKAQETEANIKKLKEELSSVRDITDPSKGAFGDVDPAAFIEALEREKEITKELAEQEKLLASQIKESDKLSVKYGASEDETSKLTQDIERLKAEAGGLQQTIDEGTARLQDFAKNATVANQEIADLSAELSRLKEEQKALEDLGIGLGNKAYDKIINRITKITPKLKEYEKALKDVHAEEANGGGAGTGGSTTGREEAQSRLNAYLEKTSAIYKKLNGVIGNTSELSAILQDVAEDTGGKIASALHSASSALGSFGTAASAIIPAASISIGVFGKAAEVIYNSFKRINEITIKALKAFGKAASTIKDFSASAVKAFSRIAEEAIALLEKINIFPKIFKSIRDSLTRLGQMIKRVFVFSVITGGLRAIRTQMSGYLKVNAEFTTALRRMQGVLLTAFQPIYDVVVPALTTLINVLSKAAAVVTQFFAAMFGTTAKQAQTNAKDLYEQANATTAAGDAAEEAAKQLAGFDEINKLEGNKSAGGGGATSVDTGPLFDYEYDETPFASWGEAFSAFLDKLLGGIPKLKEKFKDFADWLNDLNRKLYEMFTFPGVLEKVKQLGRDLADALAYLMDEIDWELWGRTLGAGINLALNFLTSFIYEFPWMRLGQHLAEFINGLADEIDWYEFGRLLWSGFKIGLETLAGFILGLDMPQLAEAASSIVLGFFDEMKNTINKIPWGEIGTQIADFLANLKWYEMLSSITDAIAAGIMAAVKALRGFIDRIVPELDRIAKEIVTALIEFFRDKVDWKEMAQTISDGISAALRFVAGLLDPELFGEIGAAIGRFFANIKWGEVLDALTTALANGINSAIKAVQGFLNEVGPNIQEIATTIGNKINEFVDKINWDELGKVISDGINTALEFIANVMETLDWGKIRDAIDRVLSNIDWDTLMKNVSRVADDAAKSQFELTFSVTDAFQTIGRNIIAGMLKGMLDRIAGIPSWLNEHIVKPLVDGFCNPLGIHSPSTVFAEIGGYLIAGLLQGISDTWHSIVEFFSSAVENLKQFFSDAWEAIKTAASTAWESIKTALSQVWDGLKEAASNAFAAIKDKIGEAWDNIKQKSSEIWNSIKTTLGETWDSIKSAVQEKFEAIKQKISDVWENIKSKTSSVWESIKSTLGTIWENLKTTASTKFQEIKSKISEVWENVKTATYNAWENVKTTIGNALSSIWSNVTSKFSEIVSAAKTWGSDICQSIADGINGAIGKVTSAAKSVANSIKDFLGFSEPKKGPLSNFHTYMPDMLELMSDGIRRNAHLATSAASELAKSIADSFNKPYTLGNISVAKMPNISDYTIPAIAKGSVIPANREFTEVVNREYTGGDSQIADIESAVVRAMRSIGVSGGGNITVVMEIDGREFGRASYRYGNQEQQRVGVRMTEART